MNILHIISKFNGGAGAASSKIINTLEGNNTNRHTILYGLGECGKENANKTSSHKKFPKAQINRLIFSLAKKGCPQGLEAFTPTSIAHRNPEIQAAVSDKDIIHLHWLGERHIDFENLLKIIPIGTPIVATMHDMNFITAGCHYSNNCQQYQESCTICPQLPGYFGKWVASTSFAKKKKHYSNHRIALVTPSKWLEEATRASHLGQCAYHIERIGYPFPEIKPPIDRQTAFQRLQITPTSKKLILIAAQNLSNRRKGTSLIVEALNMGMIPNCSILTIGEKISVINPEIRQLGFIKDPELLRCAYTCADVFCLPSLEENLAQTGIESLSEGTPVVSFSNTGPCDYVKDHLTGITCVERSPIALSQAILKCLGDKELTNRTYVTNEYRKQYETKYSSVVIKKQYEDLYEKLLS
jgi:glycosyltransferase involved in cell wall biosynthesis